MSRSLWNSLRSWFTSASDGRADQVSSENSDTRVVVGLGNPGAKYDGTRHNVGFEVLNKLAQRTFAGTPKSKYDGQMSTVTAEGRKLVLVWPLTYMNESGRCVQPLAQFYKINPAEDLLVICDDLSLPLGKLRLRPKGSAGGQKGLADILRRLGTQEVPRLRIGIDPTPPHWETSDYVLSRFRPEERETMDSAVDQAVQAVLDWCKYDLSYCMNRVN